MEESKKIKWYALATMGFSTVWGFGNVLNGFIYFNGVQVILSWVIMFALYFVPYALMVGEAGLLRRLDLLGLPHHLYRQQGQRRTEGRQLGHFPRGGDL